MLSGHAFSRSLHAHILTSATLLIVLMSAPGALDSIDKDCIKDLYKALLNHEKKAPVVSEEEFVQHLHRKVLRLSDQAGSQSRTGKLLVQYLGQECLLQHFIRA